MECDPVKELITNMVHYIHDHWCTE